jgi:hypothetical protein
LGTDPQQVAEQVLVALSHALQHPYPVLGNH